MAKYGPDGTAGSVEYFKEYHRQRYAKDPLYHRRNTVWRKYRLTFEEYEELISHPCSICGTEEKPRVCDHDHETGKVRGALCVSCNHLVGYIETGGMARLLSAMNYIEQHKEDSQ